MRLRLISMILSWSLLAHHRLQLVLRLGAVGVVFPLEVENLADRHEATNALEVDDQAALVVVDDLGLEQLAALELLLRDAPLALLTGALDRDDGVALGRLGLHHVDEHVVADMQLRKRAVATGRRAPWW